MWGGIDMGYAPPEECGENAIAMGLVGSFGSLRVW
jgi:hypothetical protein